MHFLHIPLSLERMYGYLYIIKNDVNNKVYVGKTYRSVQLRFKEHLKCAFEKNEDTKLYNAMRSIGREHFFVETVSKQKPVDLEYGEIDLIRAYDSFINGYNQSVGGEGQSRSKYDENEIIFDYENGLNIDRLSIRYRVSKSEIRKILYRNNVTKYIKTLKPIASYSKDGDYLETFGSIDELVEITGIKRLELEKELKKDYTTYYNDVCYSYHIPF